MNDVVIFAGPTLGPDDIRSVLHANIRPPVARGDVLAAALDKPVAIGIIDGYFARVPSVWHKEILWAMSQGIHVFGAASMGALRAAELAAFGMVGVGLVYEQYCNGVLTDDDEVAVIHATEQHGYRAVSDAMVNIRFTLGAAETSGVIAGESRQALEALIKALPYAERSYPMLLSLAQHNQIPSQELAQLREWLQDGRIDQKRDDALLMLGHMREIQEAGWTRKHVSYRFAQTDAWEALRNEVVSRKQLSQCQNAGRLSENWILDELLINRDSTRVFDGALARALCLDVAQRCGIELNARAIESVIDDFRREQSLLQPAQFDKWLIAHGLTDDAIVPFFEREALIRRMKAGFEAEMRVHVVDYLRTTGEYGALMSRADSKQRKLAARGMDSVVPPSSRISETELWSWYFERCRGEEIPADLNSYANRQCTSVEELRTAVIREYMYLNEAPTNQTSSRSDLHSIEVQS